MRTLAEAVARQMIRLLKRLLKRQMKFHKRFKRSNRCDCGQGEFILTIDEPRYAPWVEERCYVCGSARICAKLGTIQPGESKVVHF